MSPSYVNILVLLKTSKNHCALYLLKQLFWEKNLLYYMTIKLYLSKSWKKYWLLLESTHRKSPGKSDNTRRL